MKAYRQVKPHKVEIDFTSNLVRVDLATVDAVVSFVVHPKSRMSNGFLEPAETLLECASRVAQLKYTVTIEAEAVPGAPESARELG